MIEVSEKAVNEFKKVLAIDENKGLAIKIKAQMSQSSCCSCGPSQSYDMGLVEKGEEGDKEFEAGGVKFFMDEASMDLMGGCEVDFNEEYGFIVKDPSEGASSCGCGHDDHEHGGGSCCG